MVMDQHTKADTSLIRVAMVVYQLTLTKFCECVQH
jgi:hypothetical protein